MQGQRALPTPERITACPNNSTASSRFASNRWKDPGSKLLWATRKATGLTSRPSLRDDLSDAPVRSLLVANNPACSDSADCAHGDAPRASMLNVPLGEFYLSALKIWTLVSHPPSG